MAHITLSQLTTVLQRIVSWALNKFAAKNTHSGRLEYADMPVVVLASMGSELDGTSTQRPMSAGDTYYLPAGQGAGARIMFVDSIGTAFKISDPVSNVIYCNAYTDLLYRWDASQAEMIPVGGTSSGSIDVSGKADLLAGTGMLSPTQWPKVVLRNVSDTMLDDLASGDVYFDTGHLYLYKGDNQNPVDLDSPSSKIIYFCLADGKMYRWSGSSFQPVLATVATSGSYNDLSNKPNLATVATSGSYNDLSNKPTIPTKTSDLTNDSGFVTDEDIEDFVTAESIEEIVMGSADVSVIEADGYINIVFATANITVSEDNLVLTEASPNGTFNVSGSHLKNDITVTAPTGFKVQLAGGTAQNAVTIPHVNGTVESTTVTVSAIPSYAGQVLQGNVELESGAVSASVGVYYSQYAGPTILADSTLTIKAAAGQSNTGSLQVTGLNLTAGITGSVSGTGFSVSNTESGTYGSQASLPSSGGTLYVKFSPMGSTGSTGTLTLESTGATNKTVDLTGAVAGTLSISPASASISFVSGNTGTGTFHVNGENLTPSTTATVTVSGGGTADKQTLTVDANGEIDEDVAVTTNTSGTLTVSHTDADDNATASFTAVEVQPLPVGYYFDINNLRYTVLSGQTTVSVKQVSTSATTGAVTIPSTVNDDGLTATDGTNTATGSGMNYTVVALANDSFKYNTKVTSISIPNTVTSIGSNSFDSISKVSSLVIPDSVKSIGNYAFSVFKVTSLTIGNGVTSLSGNQFYAGNSPIATLDFGSSLSSITSGNVLKTASAANVYLRYNGVVSANAFLYNSSGQQPTSATLHVPSGQVANYKASSTWTTMFNQDNIVAI